MAVDDLIEIELMLNRFRRLMGEVQAGRAQRNNFAPWEIEILLDIEKCRLGRRRVNMLRRYQKAVERQIENGCGPPMKLSQFLELRERKRAGEAAPAGELAQ